MVPRALISIITPPLDFFILYFLSVMSESLENFITGTNYQPIDVIGEGAYGIVW